MRASHQQRPAHDDAGTEARCSRGIGRRGAKCPAGRLRLLRLGGNMRSWVLLLLLAALSAARVRLGSAEVRPGNEHYDLYEGGEVTHGFKKRMIDSLQMADFLMVWWLIINVMIKEAKNDCSTSNLHVLLSVCVMANSGSSDLQPHMCVSP